MEPISIRRGVGPIIYRSPPTRTAFDYDSATAEQLRNALRSILQTLKLFQADSSS